MAQITCGNCKSTHSSAGQVRTCYGNSGRFNGSVELPAPDKDNLRGAEPKGTPRKATTPEWSKANMDTNWSQEAPAPGARRVKVSSSESVWTTVPDGRYAIEEEGEVKFFRVKHGKADSRWAGWIFIDAQASDELWPIRNSVRKVAILAAIGNDIEAAMALYGKELGKCGHCGRTLTSEWRLRGIGPICAQKMGW